MNTMTMANALKAVFGAQTLTTASYFPACAQDGTPSGVISAANLASVLGDNINIWSGKDVNLKTVFNISISDTQGDFWPNLIARLKEKYGTTYSAFIVLGRVSHGTRGFFIAHVYDTVEMVGDFPKYGNAIITCVTETPIYSEVNNGQETRKTINVGT